MKKVLLAYWDVFLDALKDARWVLPIILAVYFLIEFIEYKYATKLQNNKLLKGNAGPVVGAMIGSIPQCGFSVVSADLFSRGAVSVGTLLAVFIATSDEAIPILIAHPESYKSLFILILAKIVLAIIVGFIASGLFKVIFKNKTKAVMVIETANLAQVEHEHEELHNDEHDEHNHDEHNTVHEQQHQQDEVIGIHDGCCHHHVETKKFDWVHPLLHSLKIFGFIILISFVFGCITHIWVGEERLFAFLSQNAYLQPLLAVIIGLIPNCASSVVLTELYVIGGLRFSALLAGLMVNAGLGIIFLLKQNKKAKENLFVILTLIISALIVGYAFVWLVI